MKLKKLILNGFKSFADKTEFVFDEGITAVVGPNGCGKSNVVDAFKWVLGEQSAKSLRGKQMLDVLFNGSSGRKSTGLAEVVLCFDNSDRRLPLEVDEVRVARRLYRSGESEYLINNQPSRLRDIKDLFLDTGVGMEAYSVIEQGRVTRFLEANPLERRTIFEEAAGISKYKVRKKEALRKLERVEQNLLRLSDVIGELEKRLRSIKYQAGKARSHQEYMGRLRELRSRYSLARLHQFNSQIEQMTEQISRLHDEASGLRGRIASGEAEQLDIAHQTQQLDERVRQADDELLQVHSAMTAEGERIEQGRRRIAELHEQLGATRGRGLLAARRCEQIAGRISDGQADLEQVRRRIEQQDGIVARLQEAHTEASVGAAARQSDLEDRKSQIFDLLRQSTQLANEVKGLEVQRQGLTAQAERARQRQKELAAQREGHVARRSELAARFEGLAEQIRQHRRELDARQAEAAALDEQIGARSARLGELRERRSALASRRALLEEMERQREGLGSGVKELLGQRDRQPERLGYVRGIVADIFQTSVENAPLVQAALGIVAQHLIVEDSAALLADAERFAALPDRVTVICQDRLPPLGNGRDFRAVPGVVCPALDLVQYPQSCQRLARHLLGRTLIVENLGVALELSRVNADGYRFVTRNGEVVEADGTIRAGCLKAESRLISRRSELGELSGQIEQIEGHITAMSRRQARASQEAARLEGLQKDLGAALYQANTKQIEVRAAIGNIEEQIRRIEQEQPTLAGELAAIGQQIEEAGAQQERCRDRMAHLEQLKREQDAETARLQRELESLEEKRNELSEQVSQARVTAAQLGEKHTATVQAVRELERSRREASAAAEAARDEAAGLCRRIEELSGSVLASESRLARLYLEREKLEAGNAALRMERDRLRLRNEQITAAVKEVRTALEAIDSETAEQQVRLGEQRTRREDLIQRVADELGVDLEEQYRDYQHQEQDWDAVAAEIQELRGKIERLGNVNLDAIAEQQELEERHSFLTTQQADVTATQGKLEELIRTLNKQSREKFVETFARIRENFQELFRKLFGGGRADVVLENPEDVLESGIEVMARPPGKELRSITLLSGGEKTLAAVALMFAIFRTKPSPVCVLDEVDAALDEANNDRFNRVVQEFLETSQFLVITHSKRTMSIANSMYGVTMQEAGVSKQVSVRFEDESAAASPAVA